jgi:hypothetical protein
MDRWMIIKIQIQIYKRNSSQWTIDDIPNLCRNLRILVKKFRKPNRKRVSYHIIFISIPLIHTRSTYNLLDIEPVILCNINNVSAEIYSDCHNSTIKLLNSQWYFTVICQLPTTVAQVRSQVRSCGICGGESGTGVGFLQVLQFPLPILIPPVAPHSLIVLSLTLYSPDTDSIIK